MRDSFIYNYRGEKSKDECLENLREKFGLNDENE